MLFLNLNQIEECENKYPDQVDKVPVETDLLNHFIMPSSLIGSDDHVEKDDHVDHDPREDVKAVKPGDKEEEVGKKRLSVFIFSEIGSFDNAHGLV